MIWPCYFLESNFFWFIGHSKVKLHGYRYMYLHSLSTYWAISAGRQSVICSTYQHIFWYPWGKKLGCVHVQHLQYHFQTLFMDILTFSFGVAPCEIFFSKILILALYILGYFSWRQSVICSTYQHISWYPWKKLGCVCMFNTIAIPFSDPFYGHTDIFKWVCGM